MDALRSQGWQAFHDVVERHRDFLLTSHVFPEGDSIGSEIALGLYLKDRGKRVRILNPSAARDCYSYLLNLYPVHDLGRNGSSPIPLEAQVVVAVDVGTWDYMGPLAELLRNSRLPIVAIDHHHPGPNFSDLGIVDPSASSTGEMIYQYLCWAGATITPEIAQALYTSVMFDTWGLRLPQTANSTVLVAAELLRHGADHAVVSRSIFQNESYQRLHLYQRALHGLHQERGGRIAWLSIPNEVFVDTGTDIHDGDGILDSLLPIAEIEVCVLFREVAGLGCRVTFRSKGQHDVGAIARQLGGGGRITAAGVFLPISLDEAQDIVLRIIRDLYTETVAACVPISRTGSLRI
ncbi:MAG: bifunctional oligoribonuclease/PAP phosphatase NrnA [Candidatus Eisenbacteria bacterium]|nr:bifunctional oligoribonuclease/PAP phosphatase NrnA [Candidatus Eisenbacteria bacterium]